MTLPRGTVRMRLTALYGALFLVTATALLVAVNLLLQHLLDQKVKTFVRFPAAGRAVPPRPEDLPPTIPWPPPRPTAAKPAIAYLQRNAAITTANDLRDSMLGYQWLVTGLAVVVLAVIAIVAGWWFAGRVLRPLHRITATARRLSLANLDERIALGGPADELKELADTFDAMLGRLERAVDGQRRFIANASHELRTPLAIQRAAIEIGLADPSPRQVARMREELLRANRRTERLIDGLLVLAQGERGLDAREPVRLDELVREVVDQYRETAAEKGVTIRAYLRPLTVLGDPILLNRLAANLVHNAIRHNRTGGHVRVAVSPESGLTVRNTGATIPPERVPEMFEPFRRLHATRTGEGAGLGLSIVASIARAHDADLSVRPNPGGGLDIAVRQPALTAMPC